MSDEKINIKKITNHWITTLDRDYETMINLFDKKDFHWALFIGHLVVERLLKASVVKRLKNHAPFTHDLRSLAKLSGIGFNEEKVKWMDTITTFNINARYDNYKQDFYKRCTLDYTEKWIENIKQLRLWIKRQL